MLVVLISVPLFAIFGKQLPDVVKGLIEGRGLVLGPAPGGDANSPPATPTQTASNPFGQPASYRATPAGSNPTTNSAAPANVTAANLTPPSAAGGPAAMPPGGSLTSMPSGMSMNALPPNRPAEMPTGSAAAMTMPGDPSAMNRAAATMGQAAMGQMPSGMGTKGDFVGSPPPLMPASNQPAAFLAPSDNSALAKPPEATIRDVTATGNSPGAPASSPYASAAGGAGDHAGGAAGAGTDEKFRQAEMRLRELGATHYMLETWGPDNSRYRFVCKMAVGGNAEVNRYFQAIDDNPWQAMQSVLAQIEQWRARPQP